MHRLNRKNKIEIGIMTVLFVLAAVFVYKTTILTRMILPRVQTQVEAEEGNTYLLSDGDHIEQTFKYPSEQLLSVGTKISLDEDTLGNLVSNEKDLDLGILHLDIKDEAGTSVMHADFDVYALADEQDLVASFPTAQTGWKHRQLTIVLDAEGIREELELAIGYSTEDISNTALTINGEEGNYTLNIQTAEYQFTYWKQWALFGAVLIYLLLLGTYLGFAVFRFKPEHIFLFAGSILSVIYLVLLPPISVPDEDVHLKEAYYFSNKLMGKEEAKEGKFYMDKEDYQAMQMFRPMPSLSEYDTIKNNLFKAGQEEGIKELDRGDTHAPALTYLPGIIGIILGRILGVNGLWVIYLGRICSILFYLFTMFWFIRLMPFGKPAAFIMAILPMTVQQCGSYSYDSIVIEVAFLYIAVLFGLLYKQEPIKRWQIALYVLFMIMLSISKGGSYLPLCLLTMLIPVSRFPNRKKKWTFVGCMAAIAIAAFLTSTLGYVLYVASPTAEQAAGAYLQSSAYRASGLLSEPMTFVSMSIRTLLASGDGFLETMLGMQLSWLNVFVSRIVIYGMLLMMILSVLHIEDGNSRLQVEVNGIQRASYAIVCVLSMAIIFASMFMSWTPRGSIVIAGIQGRYFLPFLPIFLLLFYSKNIVLKKDLGRKLMFVAVSLQCLAIYGLLISLERVL